MDLVEASTLPSGWELRSVEQVCVRVTSGGTPSRSVPAFYVGGTWSWVKTQELQDRWLTETEEHITDEALQRSSAKVLPENTILMAMYGATVGKLGLLGRSMTCNQACCALIVDDRVADFRFVYYSLLSARRKIVNLAVGAAQQNLSAATIKTFRFGFPRLIEQQRIASILGAFDDKIELNRKMTATLDSSARALFKSWFVDFDPVRAKSEGRNTGLPSEIAARFVDSFEDSALGSIPAGWHVEPLAAAAKISGGKQLASPECQPHGLYPVFGANGVMGFAERTTHNAFVIIFGRVGANCGTINWAYNGCWINNNATGIEPMHWPEYFLQAILNVDFTPMRAGSAQPFIPNSALSSLPLLRPPDYLLTVFCELVRPMRLREQLLHSESRTLAAIRDALLPKLISGALRVRDAERLVEQVV